MNRLLKMGIEGGSSFNVLVSKKGRNCLCEFSIVPTTQHCEYLLLRSRGSGALVLVCLLPPFSYHLIYFFASNCLQTSFFNNFVRRGINCELSQTFF